ncbi:MarR family winged helix-turn-helix transcriptional regulator [Pseudohongiella nitratireducens]|uniref:MarR family winged helix-turn-helix transcriptional regulator n=1 Tax=Pseudohongiella nitratireducens TaxID=1768907 RepID=UPI0030EF0A0D
MKPSKSATGIILLQAKLAARMSRKISNHLSLHGVSLTEYLALHYIASAGQPEISRILLAENLEMSASGVTRLLAPMEKNNLVERTRNPRDARQSQVRLTGPGKQVYQEASVSFQDTANDMIGELPEETASALHAWFKQMLR